MKDVVTCVSPWPDCAGPEWRKGTGRRARKARLSCCEPGAWCLWRGEGPVVFRETWRTRDEAGAVLFVATGKLPADARRP